MRCDMTKPTKWLCAERRLRSAWASTQSDQSLRCLHEETLVLSYPWSAQPRLWSDWADAQADLSLRWAHTHFVGFVMSRLMLTTEVITGGNIISPTCAVHRAGTEQSGRWLEAFDKAIMVNSLSTELIPLSFSSTAPFACNWPTLSTAQVEKLILPTWFE